MSESNLTYKERMVDIRVYLDKRFVGNIRGDEMDGYRYYPKGQTEGGERYSTIGGVKKSLEAD